MKNLPKITVRDFDPKKDMPNPVFKIKVLSNTFDVHLSKLRNMFRKYLDGMPAQVFKDQNSLAIVTCFLSKKRIEMSNKQVEKLAICFKTDIDRKIK